MKFKCTNCGKCCSHIRGNLSSEDISYIKEIGYGKLPIVHLMPPSENSFPIWPFEYERIKEYCDSNGVLVDIIPGKAVFDLISNKTIVISYFLPHDSCPFHKDNRCIIYDVRPKVCRFFPMARSPFEKDSLIEDKKVLFNSCEASDGLLHDDREVLEFLDECYHDEFRNCTEHDMMVEFVNKKIIELMKMKKLRPALNYPYEFLLKRINNSPKIDFMDFLVENEVLSEDEVKEKITGFFENKYATEKIDVK